MNKFAFLVAAGLLLAGCNSQATAPIPEISAHVRTWAEACKLSAADCAGDIYTLDGELRRVDNVSDFAAAIVTYSSSDEQLARISHVVEAGPTEEYGAASAALYGIAPATQP